MSAKQTALVTGANGFLGAAVVKELRRRGWHARALVRTGSNVARLAGVDADIVSGDVTDAASLERAVVGCDVVIHCAAATGLKRTWQECRSINVEGTANVLDAAARAGLARVVNVSSLSVYGMKPGCYDEGAPLRRENDAYGDTKIEAEELCRRRHEAGGVAVSTVRPALIVGPGDTGFFPMFLGMLRRRRFPLLGGGRASARLVFVDDVAELLVTCAEHPDAAGESYNCCAAGDLSWRAFAEQVADHHGWPRPKLSLPAAPLYGIAAVLERLERRGFFRESAPLRRSELELLVEERTYPMAKAEGQLGFRPRHSAAECVAATLTGADVAGAPRRALDLTWKEPTAPSDGVDVLPAAPSPDGSGDGAHA